MAEDIGKDDSPVYACNTFVQKLEVAKIKDKINITGWDATRVIALLKSIVNDEEKYIEGSTFTLKIKSTSAQTEESETICFQLSANPTNDHPGNGMVTNKNTGKSRRHKELSEDLTKQYRDDTCLFAKDIKSVFANNLEIFKVPEVTRDAYMILLFEIGRRLVEDESGTEKKTRLDELPIASAIARLVKFMEEGKCTFKDVFETHGKFHCFTGEPYKREKGIWNINYHHALTEIKQIFGPGQTETPTGLEASVQVLSLNKQ